MGSEIFRFVTVRPPRQVSADAPPASIDLSVSKSTLAANLRSRRPTGGRADMTGIADKFVGSAEFVASADKLPDKLPAFIAALGALPDAGFWAAAQQAFADTIGGTPADYAKAAAFTTAFNDIADSIFLRGLAARALETGELRSASDGLVRYPLLIIAPGLMAALWNGLHEPPDQISPAAAFEALIDLIFVEDRRD